MNSITSKAFQNTVFLSGVSLLALVAVLFVPAHLAHAQDYGDYGSYGDYSGCCDTGGGYSPDTYSTGGYSPDTYSTGGYSPDTYSTGGYSPDTYSTGYDTGYDTGSTGGYTLPYSSGYSTGGYSTGGFSLPYNTAPSNSNYNSNTNVNACTTNSCNTNIVTDSHNIVTNPAPIIYNPIIEQPSQPVYQPTCQSCGCQGYNNCYTPQYVPSTPICNCQAPMAYNYPPSISLSAVPYTGLDLSPTEEAIYWTFLVLWCLVAAYLIAVKKIQVSIVRWLNATLFGGSTRTTKTVIKSAHTVAPVAKTEVKTQNTDAIDPFILAQVNR